MLLKGAEIIMKNILLVVPKYPKGKSKNFDKCLPIGLLKIGAWLKGQGCQVQLVEGHVLPDFIPDEIWVTSLFTYWYRFSWDCISFYKSWYPGAKVKLGGIYATLLPGHARQSGADEIYTGIHPDAENYEPDYSLLPEELDYQIIHASRGCIRNCQYCGTYKVEPEHTCKSVDRIINEIKKNKVLFFDNNLLAHHNISELLNDLAKVKVNGKVVYYESQSGFDARLLTRDLAKKLKEARFTLPRIAWDNTIKDEPSIKAAIDMFVNAGYSLKNIQVFMIYNHDISFEEMEYKRQKCREWGVQVADCRNRPLNQLYDNYDGQKYQTSASYYIHHNWTDQQIKLFRKYCRYQNILIRINLKTFDPAKMKYKVPQQVLADFNLI